MKLENITLIAGIGTGTMGSGTALAFALGGYSVNMYGRTRESLDRGQKRVHEALDLLWENGLVEGQKEAVLERIQGHTDLGSAVEDAQFVIESVAEDLEVKKAVFREMETLCSPEAILATNTSGLSPTLISETLEKKDRFLVSHFWNPPHLMPIVEVVPGKFTSEETVKITGELLEKIGKKPVSLKKEAPGFIGNRLQFALLREALHIVDEGIASREDVDRTMRFSLGRRLADTGPLESADLGGLDIFYNVASYLFRDLSNTPDVSPLLRDPAIRGDLGAKTGKGIYQWTESKLKETVKFRERTLVEWLKRDSEGKSR